VYTAAWTGDPLAEIGAALLAALPPDDAWAAELSLARPALSVELLQEVSRRLDADIYLLLDQFEELALYQTGPAGAAFDTELGRIVGAQGLRVSVLLGVRDDALATLDRLEAHVPGLFDNLLRLGHLNRNGGREAIEQPLVRYNRELPQDGTVTIEPGLVEDLLDQLQAGAVLVSDAGAGTVTRSEWIEAPFLQLVMTRLWAAEPERPSRVLRRATLSELGGVAQIVRTHLDAVMADLEDDERETAAAIFRYLVTPSGMKISHTAEDLADYVGLGASSVRAVLEKLSSGRERVLRPVPPPTGSDEAARYEIFHDVMAPAVLDWRRRYVAERERLAGEQSLVQARLDAETRHRATQRRLRGSRILSACLAILLITTGVSLVRAEQSERRATSQKFLAEYEDKLTSDPADSLRAAVDAYETRATPEAESAVRVAFDADMEELRLRADAGPLWSSKFSPDGSTLLTAGTDGVAKLYDRTSGTLLRKFEPGTSAKRDRLVTASFSPDGELVVTATISGAIRTFVTATGADLGQLTTKKAWPNVAWGVQPDRSDLLVSDGSGPAELWDARRRTVIARYGSSPWGATLSNDGRHVVAVEAVGQQGWVVTVWDSRSGRLLRRSAPFKGVPGMPRFVGSKSDRIALLLSAAPEGSSTSSERWRPNFWSWQKKSARFQAVQGESRTSAFLAVSQDGRLVAVPLDKRVRVFDADDGLKQVGQTPEAPDWINAAVTFSSNGRWLATSGGDGRARVWLADRDNNQPIAQLAGHGSAVADIQFDPSNLGGLATAGLDGTARVWRLPERTILHGAGSWILGASVSQDGTMLVTAEDDGRLETSLLDSDDPASSEYAKTGSFPWYGVLQGGMFTPDGGKVIVAGASSYAPAVWDWRDQGYAWSLDSYDTQQTIVTFAPSSDSNRVAAADADGQILLWDLQTEKIVARVPATGDGSTVTALVALAEPTWFAAGGSDGTIRLWDMEHRDAPRRVLGRPGDASVVKLYVSFDGAHLASLTEDHAVQIWRLADGELLRRIDDGPRTTTSDVAISRDGELLAVAAADGTVHIWRWATGQKLAVLHRHGDLINSVEFLPDGRLVTGSDDTTVAIFPCTTCGDFEELLQAARTRVASRK
jgi:WD40 repeat protein